MDKRLTIASIMLYVVSAMTIISGFIYLFSPGIMFYHETFLGMTHEQLEPKVAALFLSLMRVVGATFLSIGVALAMLVKDALTKRDGRAWQTILVMSLIYLVLVLFITLSVGLFTPWWLIGIMLILVIAAMSLSMTKP